MTRSKRRPPVLNFSTEIDEIVADNQLVHTSRQSDLNGASKSDQTKEPDASPPPKFEVPNPETETRKETSKPVTIQKTHATDGTGKSAISLRVPIYDEVVINKVRQDAQTYKTTEKRLLAVYVRKAIEKLRSRLHENDLSWVDPGAHGANAIASYETTMMASQAEIEQLCNVIDPSGYFGPSRNLSIAISQLISSE